MSKSIDLERAAAERRAIAALHDRFYGIRLVTTDDEARTRRHARELCDAHRAIAIDSSNSVGAHQAVELRRLAFACEDLGAHACARHLREFAAEAEAVKTEDAH